MQVIILDIDVAIYHDMVGGDMARVTSLGNAPIYHMQVIILDIDVCSAFMPPNRYAGNYVGY